jgi:thiamine-phosphate pyrophosphorylase
MSDSSEQWAVWRIIDANLNRANEGLRVVEDFARFHSASEFLAASLKSLRHRLAANAALLDQAALLAARDTTGDVGTKITVASETQRDDVTAVLRANFQRVQQALRSLEEFGKTLHIGFASECEQIRYASYTLEKSMLRTHSSRERLSAAKLYVLLSGQANIVAFEALATELVAARVHVIQLRDKELCDRDLLQRAYVLRKITLGSDCLFIVNDRPDIALLADADGVHVGQDELSVAEVRKILGPQRLVGVSTHDLDQAREAVLAGADYLGCGPTFPSGTKSFTAFPGLAFLKAVASEISIPAFAIGGITHSNLSEVMRSGFSRIAVSGAILQAEQPAQAARDLLRGLGCE